MALALMCEAARADEGAAGGEGYFRRHAWHWATAAGMRAADMIYDNSVGVSTDPLLFSDPPGFDRWVRDQWMSDDPPSGWVLDHAGKLAGLIGVGTSVLGNLGRAGKGRLIADDVTGIAEVWLFDKGASGLIKNIVGRQRPELEFIDETDLTPAEKQAEEENASNHKSFYSGSTSQLFAMMDYSRRVITARQESRAARVGTMLGFYALGAYSGYARIARDRHYATDVIAGAAVGIFEGRGFYNAHHHPKAVPEIVDEDHERRIRLASLHAGRDGAAVVLGIQLGAAR